MKKHILLTAVLAVFIPLSGAAETLKYRFDVRLGVAKIGEMTVAVENTGNTYAANGSLYTTGLVGAIYDARYDSYAEGRVGSNGDLLPVRHTAISNEKGKISTTEIAYVGNRVASVVFSTDRAAPSDATSHTNTIDPMSLIYELVRPVSSDAVCKGSYELFDGSKRMTVSYTNLKRYNNGRVECDVAYSGAGKRSGVSPSAVVFKPGADGRMYIERFMASTSIGSLSVSIRK